jgi:hypothetical protein
MSTYLNGKITIVSAIRNRDRTLQLLVPQTLGLFWDRGQMDGVAAKAHYYLDRSASHPSLRFAIVVTILLFDAK